MKKILQISILYFLTTQICFAQWFWQSTPIDHDLFSVKFFSLELGWIVGESGTILKTNNGGETWISQSSGTSDNLNSVSFTNINTGAAVGNNGTILRTTNGGENWVSQFSGTYYDLNGVSFTNENIGTVVGNYNPNTYTSLGIILRTTNGGETWETQSSGIKYHLSMVFFTDINNGSVVGYSGSPLEGIILRTTNGGETWTSQCKTKNALHGIYFSNAKTGMVVGTGGRGEGPLILKTNDGGETWISKTCEMTGVILNSVHLTDTNNGTAVGLKYFPSNEAVILRTTNGGETWISQTSGLSNFLNDVFFIDIYNGIVVCSGGIILRTTNGGSSLPVEFLTFTAKTNGTQVYLYWSTATELNNNGFEIQRRVAESDFVTIGFVKGEGTTTNQREYSYIDKDLVDGKYFYRLKQFDYNGTSEYSDVIEVDVRTLDEFALEQNFPNPFNPTTTIGFGIPEKGNVRLSVLNILGEEIKVLLNEEKEAGYHSIDFNASELPSGVYFYQLKAGEFISTKKMLLLK